MRDVRRILRRKNAAAKRRVNDTSPRHAFPGKRRLSGKAVSANTFAAFASLDAAEHSGQIAPMNIVTDAIAS